MIVVKRDGDFVEYDLEKISMAIAGAFQELGEEFDDDQVLEEIERIIFAADDSDISVEDIQNIVEDALIAYGYIEEAKAYIRYRYLHQLMRKESTEKKIAEKLFAKNVQNQNANVDEYSFGGRKGEAANELMKHFALDHLISKRHRDNHLNNRIYIHDLDSYATGMHNCLTIPFDDLLANGFNTRQTDVRPANSVNTAMQLVAVIFQLQSLNQFGGVSASHIDWTMVPYVRKSFYKHFKDGMYYCNDTEWSLVEEDFNDNMSIDDIEYKNYQYAYEYAIDMTKREVHQAVEGMYHNLNTLQSRSGDQLPFTSLNYGTCTTPEGRMVTRALLEVSIEGLGKLHKTSIFPCGIFQCMKGVNRKPGDPNYDLFQLALKSTAKRLYPNYANVDWSTNVGYDPADPETYVSTMGCRTYNGVDINADEGVCPQRKDGRGNIAPCTIILPTLAMEANCDIDKFFSLLEDALVDAKDELIERYNWIIAQDPSSAKFMYENNTMRGFDGKTIESAMKHGTLVIGQIALAETLQLLIGCDQTTSEGMILAKKIEKIFKDRCAEFKQEYKLNFGVYYTPAENLCYTAMNKFKAKYGIIPKVSDKEYFTNSIHVPVYHNLSAFDKIDIESQLTNYSNAGCITYVELDSSVQNNLEALERLVNYAMDKDIPYFAVNVPNDTCLKCGYTDEIGEQCPMCGSTDIQRLRRVTGYLTGNYKTAFNWGKQKETEARVKHDGLEI